MRASSALLSQLALPIIHAVTRFLILAPPHTHLQLPIEEQALYVKIETPRMRRACGPRGPRCPAARASLGHLGEVLSPATLEVLDSMPLDELILQQVSE